MPPSSRLNQSQEISMRVDHSIRQISPDSDDEQVKRLKEVYEWKITEFGNLEEQTGESIHSATILANHDNKDKWYLELYPYGRDKDCKDYFSLYLILKSTKRSQIRVRYELSIRNSRTNEKLIKRDSIMNFVSGKSSGWRHFVTRERVLSHEDIFLKDDELKIYCELDYNPDELAHQSSAITAARASTSCELRQDLWNFAKKSEFSDVMFVVGNKTFSAHKNVLAAHSKAFLAMFNTLEEHTYQRNDGIHRREVKSIEPNVFEKVLEFIYTGSIANTEGIADDLLAAAHRFELNELKTMCEGILSDRITIRNAADTLVLAHEYQARELKTSVLKFITKHLVGVIESEGWTNLENEHSKLMADLLRAVATEKKAKVVEKRVTFKEDVMID